MFCKIVKTYQIKAMPIWHSHNIMCVLNAALQYIVGSPFVEIVGQVRALL